MAEQDSKVIMTFEPLAVKVQSAAKMMDTSENVVRNLVKAGYLKAMKFPSITIPVAEIKRFIDYELENNLDFTKFGDPYYMKSKDNKVVKLKEA